MAIDFHAFDVNKPVCKYYRDLPHWRQKGATYFVTFRLWDSLPASALEHLHAIRRMLVRVGDSGESWVEADRALFLALKRFLDAEHGACFMRNPEIRGLIEESLARSEGPDCQLGALSVMPNHVHVLVRPVGNCELEDLLQTWKSVTAHLVNKHLGRRGRVWQDEAYDRIVRNTVELARTERYILGNATRSAAAGAPPGGRGRPPTRALDRFVVTCDAFALRLCRKLCRQNLRQRWVFGINPH